MTIIAEYVLRRIQAASQGGTVAYDRAATIATLEDAIALADRLIAAQRQVIEAESDVDIDGVKARDIVAAIEQELNAP